MTKPGWFPTPYPDELMYSVIARYYSSIDPDIKLDHQPDESHLLEQPNNNKTDNETSRVNRLKGQGGEYADQLDNYTPDLSS